MAELKPCPFCGGEGEKKKYRFQGKIVYVIMCKCCTCRSPMFLEESKERAIIAWNKRTQFDDGGYHDGA